MGGEGLWVGVGSGWVRREGMRGEGVVGVGGVGWDRRKVWG